MMTEIKNRDSQPPGRNEPCPCGSRKKYKRCCGVSAAPKLSVPKFSPSDGANELGLDPSLLNSLDPEILKEMSQAFQKLPKSQLQRMQALMEKAMNGRDITAEAQEFEKSLPVDFQNQMRSWAKTDGPSIEPDFSDQSNPSTELLTKPSLDFSSQLLPDLSPRLSADASKETYPPESGPMTEEKARALIARAAAEGAISSEQANALLGSTSDSVGAPTPSSPTHKLGRFWKNLSGKKIS